MPSPCNEPRRRFRKSPVLTLPTRQSLLTMVQSVEFCARPRHRRNRACRMAPALVRAPAQPDRITAESNRPHVRWVVASHIPDDIEDALVRELPSAPLPIRLGGVVVFGGRRLTLARLVVPTTELLTLQRIVYELIADCEGCPRTSCPASGRRTSRCRAASSPPISAPPSSSRVPVVATWSAPRGNPAVGLRRQT